MNTIREFAERVLFAESLEEKLSPPPVSGLSDNFRGDPLVTPELPGRPQDLQFSHQGVKVGFPGTKGIENDHQRGKLLHFFANHELLATELMALVLLKFPDAPDEFRAGVLKTLKEEQMHTKLYLRRMSECGVEFGELPVNGFFWKLVSTMETPLDYVTRLSLTFEQANLDYAKGYARVFSRSGDNDTAAILDRIYRDEIGHVHYGLSWFRQWKQNQSDWKSFCSLLNSPLSAERAKGNIKFNEEGRREAGLDEEFIRELKAFSRSRGRTPVVHWFNPGAEEELAGKPGRRAMNQITRDLELLMAFVARRDDVVLLDQVPPLSHRLALKQEGIELPELMTWQDKDELSERKLGGARPWAATPMQVKCASELGIDLEPTSADLFSKLEHAKLLQDILHEGGWDLLADAEVVGREVHSIRDIELTLRKSRYQEWILKSPVSTAGRDRVRFTSDDLPDIDDFGSEGMLLEPWLERILDFSIQYDRIEDGRLKRRGSVVLNNTRGGQFQSARVTSRVIDGLPEEDRRLVFSNEGSRGKLAIWLEEVFEPVLEGWLAKHSYYGPLGVDAMFYRDLDGALRFKPVVEINPRVTMGRVAVELSRFSQPKGTGELMIQSVKQPDPENAIKLTFQGDASAFSAWWRK